MPSLKLIEKEGDEATPNQQQQSPNVKSKAKKNSQNTPHTPLELWLSPSRSIANNATGTIQRQPLKRLNPEVSEHDENVPKKLKMHEPSKSQTGEVNEVVKKTADSTEETHELKQPPEILYNLIKVGGEFHSADSEQLVKKSLQVREEASRRSQSSGECTEERNGRTIRLGMDLNTVKDLNSTKSRFAGPSETIVHSADGQPTIDQNSEEESVMKAIQLSKQQAAIDEAHRKAREEREIEEALRRSKSFLPVEVSSGKNTQNGSNVIDLYDFAHSEGEAGFQSYDNFFKELTREQFEKCLDDFFNQQVKDGIDRIEKGPLVRIGNGQKDFKQGVAANDNGNQERAQYGRLSTDALYNIIDSLSGVEPNSAVAVDDEGGLPDEAVGPIHAFMDIGSGIGIQVLQAGYVYGIKSRGIEVMQGRYDIGTYIHNFFKEVYPDGSKIRLLQGDFARSFPDGAKNQNGEPDELIRNFLLCNDLSCAEQKHLVVFINNAEDVFASRSNDSSDSRSLDSFLAELLGNLRVGVRFVTFTSVSKYMERIDWWREDVLELEPGCVSWSNKAQKCFVLTKLKDSFVCDSCPGYETSVVDESGRLQVSCVYCEKRPVRTTKRVKKNTTANKL